MSDAEKIKSKTEELKDFLEEEGFDVWLQDFEGADNTLEVLCMGLPDDEYGTDRVVQFIFLPLKGIEPLDGVECLQVIYGLPVEINDGNSDALAEALDVLNNVILAGHLGFFENSIVYRYSYFIPKIAEFPIDGRHYIDHIIFLITTVVGFTALIEIINSGDGSLDDFIEALAEIQDLGKQARLE